MKQMISLLLALTMLMGYQGGESPSGSETESVQADEQVVSAIDSAEDAEPIVALAYAEAWWLLNKSGKLLKQVSSPDGYATVTGLTLLVPEAGAYLTTQEDQAQQATWLLELLAALQESGLADRLERIDLSGDQSLIFILDGRFTVHISPTLGKGMHYWLWRLSSYLDYEGISSDQNYTVEIMDDVRARFIPD